MKDVTEIIGNHTGLSRIVLDYSLIMKDMLDVAKRPGFSVDSWAPLAAYVDTASFKRIGNFKEEMNWADYIGFLTVWAPNAEWECSFKRITESGSTVFLELEERSKMGAMSSVVNSMSVYEFNADQKLVHLDIYLQMPMPDPEMLQSYEGINISDTAAA